LPNVKVVTLPVTKYSELGNIKKKHNLDFDDAYQYLVSKHYKLKIATMDSDFKKVKDLEVVFL